MAQLRLWLERLAYLCRRRWRRGALERPAQDQLAALRATHARQCASLGCDYAFPDFLGDRSYRILRLGPGSALVVKATHEAFVIADSPEPFLALVAARDRIAARLRAAGIDELHAWTPPGIARRMGGVMRALGFRDCSPGWHAWYREL